MSTIDSDQSLFDDVKNNYAFISDKTIIEYLKIFKRFYIIEEIEAWNPNIRSKTAIRTSPKKSMIDPSLATSVLGVSPQELIYDVRTFGLLFENLVSRDLSVYARSIEGTLNHYRDRYGLECDNVVHFSNGKYALIEVKLGGNIIQEAEEHLNHLENLIKESNTKIPVPSFKMIITGTIWLIQPKLVF